MYRFLLICLALLVASCGKEPRSGTLVDRTYYDESQIREFDAVKKLHKEQRTIRQDLADIFCVHVYKLPHKSDFNKELAYLCEDNKPSESFRRFDRLAQQAGDSPRSVQLSLRHGDEYTEGAFVAAYTTPLPPKWVRSGGVQNYMMQPSRFDYVSLDGLVKKDRNKEIGGDLQFSKYDFNYKTNVATPDRKPFNNERNTEFNAYQVHGGNPDIGIGTEHLIDENSLDFPYFNTITVTIGTESGGSVLITIIRGSVKHNGYPELAARVFSDTTTAQASNVRSGLMADESLKQYYVD